MATPKCPSPTKQRARLSPTPCFVCGKPVIKFRDGTQRCIDGISHSLERELGLRREPKPEGEPDASLQST